LSELSQAHCFLSLNKTSALVDVLEKRVQTITSQIDQNTIMVLQSEADIKKLNQSLSIMEKLIGKIVLTQKSFDLTVYGLYTSLILEEQLKRMEQLETAIDHLLLGKFHKGLVSIDGILDALAKLKTNALNHGLLVGVQRPLELYQLPVSFLFNSTSRIIHAILHIPLYRESKSYPCIAIFQSHLKSPT
jgi:hypothetical protein